MALSPAPAPRTECRICHTTLVEVFSLGDCWVSDFPKAADTDLLRAPLRLAYCPTCTLVQLTHTVPREHLYRTYWYRSGINETMREELTTVVRRASAFVQLAPGHLVVDIGANDGTLLSNYPEGVVRVAYEPATNLYELLRPHADVLVSDFFPPSRPELPVGSAKIITSIAMFYDLDDPLAFCHEIKRILHPDGVWIIQLQDLRQMLLATAVDNICHEHLEYYSLYSLARTLDHNGLYVVHVEHTPINGGSLRVYVQHRDPKRVASPQVVEQIDAEDQMGLLRVRRAYAAWQEFGDRAGRIREQLQTLCAGASRTPSGLIALYGASTKGNTLLQWLGLTHDDIRYAIERDPRKVGRYVGATGIPIVAEATARETETNLDWLVPIWQFRDAVVRREQAHLDRGGRLIFPLPAPEVVTR